MRTQSASTAWTHRGIQWAASCPLPRRDDRVPTYTGETSDLLEHAIMTSGADNDQPQFAVVFAPGGRDAEVIVSVLETAGSKPASPKIFPDFVTSLGELLLRLSPRKR
jgi:hypothetical protein